MPILPNATPLHIGPPRFHVAAGAVLSAANTNRDGTGTIVELWENTAAAVPNGSRIRRIKVKATGTTTAGMIRFYVSVDTGTTWRLYDEMPVTAITPSATVESFEGNLAIDLDLPSGCSLGASTHNAETFHVTTEGNDY